MKTVVFPIAFLLALISGCEKDDISSAYPSIYPRLPSATLEKMRSSFTARNPFISSSLNDFGFCDFYGDLSNVAIPPKNGPVTEQIAIETAVNFIKTNKKETGVYNPNHLSFCEISSDTIYDGSVMWHLRSENQKYDTIEVLYTSIVLHLTNGYVTSCYGNWYPEINVPHTLRISRDNAKTKLVGKTVTHYTFSGAKYYVNITKNNLDACSVNLKILPLASEGKIELRVCWVIDIPDPIYYKMYVDALSGEIVQTEPTIVSIL